MNRNFFLAFWLTFLMSLTIYSGVVTANQKMIVYHLNEDGTRSIWTEVIPYDPSKEDESVPPVYKLPADYTPELVVLADDAFSWDIPPVCSNVPVTCSALCGGPWGHEDFDETWGPLTAPQDLKLVVGWKPNGCTSRDGKLDFYIVPDACGGDGVNIYTVTGDLGYDYQNFSYSPEIDVSSILNPGQTYYFRVVEEDDPSCGGADYHISGIGVFTIGAGSINGHVADKITGKPIKYALVIAIQQPEKKGTFTGPYQGWPDGYYEIKDLQAGTWLVICMKKDYKPGIATVEVNAGATTTKDFQLRPKPAGDNEDEFADLYANYPNPFNPDTWIPYYLSQDADVTIRIYNSTGQLVRILNLGRQVAGIYIDKDKAAYWDGKDDLGQRVASGVYYYTIQAGNFSATRKMVVVK